MKKTKVSIVTPSYNQGEFIQDTLQSVLAQVDGSFELEYIILDSVSMDDTKLIIEKYLPKLRRAGVGVTFISKKDKGQTNAINNGLSLATGQLYTYLNSDDFYEPDVLRKVVKYFEQNSQIQWAFGGWNYVNRVGKIYSVIQPSLFSYNKLLDYCTIGQPSCFFRSTVYQEVGPFDESLQLGMDYEYWLRLSQHYPAGVIPEVISNMRYYGGTKSASKASQHLVEAYKLATRYTAPLSFKRLVQFFFFLRGYAVILLGIDITRRIERKEIT
ncbi:glycosyltransferase [Candidatus Woesebacteria bacterium]|nr:glycosyltransferase [Candidatus Woesebacteria bacterium]